MQIRLPDLLHDFYQVISVPTELCEITYRERERYLTGFCVVCYSCLIIPQHEFAIWISISGKMTEMFTTYKDLVNRFQGKPTVFFW